jgi:hypothetical protein
MYTNVKLAVWDSGRDEARPYLTLGYWEVSRIVLESGRGKARPYLILGSALLIRLGE